VQIHPLWQTPMLPLLFLISAIVMGYAVVLFESCVAASAYRRRSNASADAAGQDHARHARRVLAVRFGDLRGSRRLGQAFVPSVEALTFWVEMLCFVARSMLIGSGEQAAQSGQACSSPASLMLGGVLLRLNGFLIGYDTNVGDYGGWTTSRPWPEMLVTIGMFASRFSATSSSPAVSRCCRAKTLRRPTKFFKEEKSMSKRVTIDPVTRIEGHLRVDVEVDGGRVKKAWSSGQMWRGVENILIGRDPRDAWAITQRICGVCTTVHAIASVRAVENALQLEIPVNAQYIRNLIILAHAVHDHIVHFYHLSALDWVDVVSALKADPAKAASAGREPVELAGNSKHEIRQGAGAS
jgi:hypothetical protein